MLHDEDKVQYEKALHQIKTYSEVQHRLHRHQKRKKNIYLSYILSSVMCVDNAKNFVFWDLFWKKKYNKTYH